MSDAFATGARERFRRLLDVHRFTQRRPQLAQEPRTQRVDAMHGRASPMRERAREALGKPPCVLRLIGEPRRRMDEAARDAIEPLSAIAEKMVTCPLQPPLKGSER